MTHEPPVLDLSRYPHVTSPVTVGTLALRHRLVVPPHGGGGGHLIGGEAEFEQHCAMWVTKARGGMQWLGGAATFVRNPLPLGFEPSGIGAHGPGFFRDPSFPDRMSRFVGLLHDAGAYISVQMVQQGGMPTGPSNTYSSYADHRIAHALNPDELQWLIREYAESAALALDAGADAIEIHANHDDVVQWFLSPLTNLRTDGYGGSFDNRRRFLREISQAIRAYDRRPFTFGLRLCLDELIDDGYGLDECRRLIEAFTADGTVDYFSLDVGSNWGNPSYVQVGWHDEAEWAALCGAAKQATDLPVVYAGRVTSAATAERILADGHADLVAMARATMADPDIVRKELAVAAEPPRPCIGLNECINRKAVEGLSYACGVNPAWAREAELADVPARTSAPRSILVVGGGPAGMELAALAAEQGHEVRLWERKPALGGLLAVASMVRANSQYRRWIDWQVERLAHLGVQVELGRDATVNNVVAAGADHVAVATGATPRLPRIPGIDQPHVLTVGQVLVGGASLGRRVGVLCEDDGPAPLSVSDHLAALGHEVTIVFQSAGPAPLVGKYSIGSMLARLVDRGVKLVPMARVTAIGSEHLELASTYGHRTWTAGPFDSVVVIAGAIPDDALHQQLRAVHPSVHLLGDAFAPRRVVFATRQAHALARSWL